MTNPNFGFTTNAFNIGISCYTSFQKRN